jgi:hypothetical protein
MTGARNTGVLKHLVIDLLEQIHVDVVGLEGVGVLAKTDPLQPFSDLAHALSCSVITVLGTGKPETGSVTRLAHSVGVTGVAIDVVAVLKPAADNKIVSQKGRRVVIASPP